MPDTKLSLLFSGSTVSTTTVDSDSVFSGFRIIPFCEERFIKFEACVNEIAPGYQIYQWQIEEFLTTKSGFIS
jgi:hypothetical protein